MKKICALFLTLAMFQLSAFALTEKEIEYK